MTLILNNTDSTAKLPELPQVNLGQDLGATMYTDASQFRAATAPQPGTSADAHLSPLTIHDDKSCGQPESIMQKLERWGSAVMYWEQGKLAPKDLLEPPSACPAQPLKPGDSGTSNAPTTPDTSQDNWDRTTIPGSKAPGSDITTPGQSNGEGATLTPAPDPSSRESVAPNPDALPSTRTPELPRSDQPALQPGQMPRSEQPSVRLETPPAAQPTGPVDHGQDGKGPEVNIGPLPIPGQGTDQPHTPDVPHAPTDVPHVPAKPATPEQPGDEIQREIQKNVGKPVTELEHGINPRLGCARMASHILHEADPSFPETNNSAEFRRLLKQHGYEEVTVKPGDPALAHSQPGDVLIGRRPDGMPSHAAISMGDGKVFNNNSDSGRGQVDSLDQFKQGMHDSQGHWNKNGFADVTIFRKKAQPAPSGEHYLSNAV